MHAISGLNTGGAEFFLCRLIEQLRPPAFEHTVVVLGAEGMLSSRVTRFATLHHLGMRPGRMNPSALLRLRQLLREVHPDVVHGWMYHANLVVTLACVHSPVPVLWSVRQSLYDLACEKRTTRLVIRACALLSQKPARVIYNATASATQHTTFGFSPDRALVIPNGYDTAEFAPDWCARERLRAKLDITPDALAIGLVARVHPMKDHANFLRAAARFAKDWPQTVFVLVGDGAEDSNRELSTLIQGLELRPRVRLCGRRLDIAAVDNALDISSSSSWAEAFPNALAEAMACGTPCVATEVGDVREIIGDTGIVVPPRDSAALSEGWATLATLGKQGRHELGLRARSRITARYSLATVARRYADLYADVAVIR